MNSIEILKQGGIQLSSAGTGIRHNEVCNGNGDVHVVQIWAFPWNASLKPTCFTRHFTQEEKQDKWVLLDAPMGSDVQRITLWATLLSPNRTISHEMPSSDVEREVYMQVVQTSEFNLGAAQGAHVRVGFGNQSIEMRDGDGAFVHAAPR
ncbi:hypothetical protein BJV78DRAFT_1151233 [Lactifluus subvellereus]|nr:hypothetical protein BJV78DRAFT_1151233 [Lactifluus subvellereus]